MGIATLIIGLLTGLPAALAGLKDLIAALGKLYDDVFQGDHAKVDAVVQTATNVVASAEADTTVVGKWFTDSYPTIEALLADFTGLPKLMYSAKNVASDHGIDLHTALTTVQLAANALKQA